MYIMKRITLSIITLMAAISIGTAAQKNYTLNSPDGRISVEVSALGNLTWSVSFDGREVLSPSVISMTLEDGTVYGEGAVKRGSRRSVSRDIKTSLYKKSIVKEEEQKWQRNLY